MTAVEKELLEKKSHDKSLYLKQTMNSCCATTQFASSQSEFLTGSGSSCGAEGDSRSLEKER